MRFIIWSLLYVCIIIFYYRIALKELFANHLIINLLLTEGFIFTQNMVHNSILKELLRMSISRILKIGIIT